MLQAPKHFCKSWWQLFVLQMFVFGTKALEKFVDRLIEWPQYCQHILQISHLRGNQPELVAFIDRLLARNSSSYSESDAGYTPTADQHHNSISQPKTEVLTRFFKVLMILFFLDYCILIYYALVQIVGGGFIFSCDWIWYFTSWFSVIFSNSASAKEPELFRWETQSFCTFLHLYEAKPNYHRTNISCSCKRTC